MLGKGSIWGKVIGGIGGFVVGGPTGAMFGTFAGHAVDRARDRGLIDRWWPAEEEAPQVGFTAAFVIIAGKMAGLEGRPVRDRLVAFTGLFQVAPHEIAQISAVFSMARRDSSGFEPYARLLAEMFADNRETREELLEALIIIGQADGPLTIRELDFLLQVAVIFGLDAATVQRLLSQHRAAAKAPPPGDAYSVLEVERGADMKEIKAAYRRKVREHHPDAMMAEGASDERINAATRKVAAINAAYEQICRERGVGRG